MGHPTNCIDVPHRTTFENSGYSVSAGSHKQNYFFAAVFVDKRVPTNVVTNYDIMVLVQEG